MRSQGHMDRREFLKCMGVGTAALAVPGCASLMSPHARTGPSGPARRPNVLFIAVDDLRPELGCYGNPIIHSPCIDRVAQQGVVFGRAYCQQAVCSPSRSSLLTGTRPDTTRVWDLQTHFRTALPDVVTLPQLFKNEGYFVQGMGKIYHGGFDDPPSWSVPWTKPDVSHNPREKAQEPDAGATPKKKRNRGPAFEAFDGPDNALHDGALADMAIQALRDIQPKGQPFFLGVGFIKPHLPFVSPKQYWDLYDPSAIPLAPNPFLPKDAPAYALLDRTELWSYDGVPNESHLPDEYARQLNHGYYAAVSYMDAQVGRVVNELESLGLREDTLILLWGDHGWKLGEHDRWCKHSTVENDTHAPLIVSVPGMKHAGKTAAGLVEFVDIYPTLATLAGLPLPEHLEGASFSPLLEDPTLSWKKAAFSQYPRFYKDKNLTGYAMRTDRYRFTRWVDRMDHSRVDAVELYDHVNDPQENVNIAGAPENRRLVQQLTKQWLAGWKGAMPKV